MKIKFLAALAFLTLITACSSSDDSGGSGGIYMPLETGNYWTYKVIGEAVSERDSLYVSGDIVIDTKTYKEMKTLNQPVGFFSNSLNNNGLRKDGSSLKMSGEIGLNIGEALPISIPVSDFIIFKENASNNQELSSVSGTIEQTIATYPMTIDYTLKSISVETLATFTTPAPDSKTYTDVKKVKTIMNMEVAAIIAPVPFPITIMNSQDVVVSVQYYSKNIGMVYANTVIEYELAAEIPGSTIPQTGSQTQEEFLDTYQVD